MSLSIIYLIVFAVSIICGFAGINRPNSKLNMVACIVMLAGCVLATHYYSWFHILGLVGITIVGLNIFNAISIYKRSRANEKARIDEIFRVDDDEEEE